MTEKPTPQTARLAEKYLIGPRTYPAFEWTLRWGLLLLAAGFAIWFALPVVNFILRSTAESAAESGAEVNSFVSQLVRRIVTLCVAWTIEFSKTALMTVGALTLVFAALEHFSTAPAAHAAHEGESLEEGR